MRRFSVCWLAPVAVVLCMITAQPAAAAATTDHFYNPGDVSLIDITLEPAAYDALVAAPKAYVGGKVTLTIAPGTPDAEVIGPLVAEVKLKGNSSFRPLGEKAAFTVKFSKNPAGNRPFGGTTKGLTLNNMTQDPSMMHETLGYQLMRAAGVPAPRTGYAVVRVNNTVYGLYLNLERFDEALVDRLFPGNTQHLYEADSIGVDLRPGQASTFEVDEGDEGDISDLEAMIEAIHAPTTDWWASSQPYVDLDEMTKMWAVEHFIGHWDGYSVTANPTSALDPGSADPSNYYLHSDKDGRFSMLPTGLDQTFTHVFNPPFVGTNQSQLVVRCAADKRCLTKFATNLAEFLAATEPVDFDVVVDALASKLAPVRAALDNGGLEPRVSDAEWNAAVEATRNFFKAQRPALIQFATDLYTQLGIEPGTGPTTPGPAPGDPDPRNPGPPTTSLPGPAEGTIVIGKNQTGVVEIPQSNTLITVVGALGGVELRLPRGAVVALSPDTTGTTVRVRGAGARITLGGQQTVLSLTGSRNTVTASGTARRIVAKGSHNRIRATRAAASISAGARAVITTGKYNDRVTVGAGSTVKTGAGNDYVRITRTGASKKGAGPRSTIDLGRGNDTFRSRNRIADTVNGGPGRDRAINRDNKDRLRSVERR